MRLARVQVYASIVVALVLVMQLTACKWRSYDRIPDGVHGQWDNVDADISGLDSITVQSDKVIVAYEDGSLEICYPTGVEVEYAVFRQGKTTDITCNTAAASSRAVAVTKSCAASRDYKLLHWTIALSQADLEINDRVELTQILVSNCDLEFSAEQRETLTKRASRD